MPSAVADSLTGELQALVRVYRGESVLSEGPPDGGAEAAVVLGAQVVRGGTPSATLRARARYAASL